MMIQRRGITMIEVLVVLAAVVFMAGLTVMLLVRHLESAKAEQCKNNLKRIGEAIRAYHDASALDETGRRLPPSRIADGYATWAVLLAPYVIKDHPLQLWDQQQSYFAQEDSVRQPPLLVYLCPARQRAENVSSAGDVDDADKHFSGGLGDYASAAGDGSMDADWKSARANGPLVIAEVIERKDKRIVKWQSRTSLASLQRGQSNTLLVGEKHVPVDHFGDAAFGDGSLYNGGQPASFSRVVGPGFPLAERLDSPFHRDFGSRHNGVCFFLFADMKVQGFTTNASAAVLGKLARRGE